MSDMSIDEARFKKAIRHFECIKNDAQVVLDNGFGTHKGESTIVYDNRIMYADMAIEALKFQKEYQTRLEAKETIAQLQDVTISMLGADKDMLVDKLNRINKENQANAKKCIEKIKIKSDDYFYETRSGKFVSKDAISTNDVIEIIKEEMGLSNGSTEE